MNDSTQRLSTMSDSAQPGAFAARPWLHKWGGMPVVEAPVVYAATALVTLGIARLAFGQAAAVEESIRSLHLKIGLVVVVTLAIWVQCGFASYRFWQAAWVAFCLLVLVVVVSGQPMSRTYGDSDYLLARITSGVLVSKWLAGTAIASWVHSGVWQFPPIAARLPSTLLAPAGFLGVIGALAICSSTVASLGISRGRPAVVFATLTPIWVMLSSGYLEYYPLAAGALIGVLLWLFDGRLGSKPSWSIGLVVAALPLLYVAYAPLAGLILVSYAIAAPRRMWSALVWTLIAFPTMIAVLWPAGVNDFLHHLTNNLNLGEAYNFPGYQGMVAGPHSIFFTASFAFSTEHVQQLARMYFWGGGIVAPVLLAALAPLALRRRKPSMADARIWLALALLIWHLCYFFFMVPRLGPTRDVDLFHNVYVTIAFLAGLATEAALPSRRTRAELLISAAFLGNTAALAFVLMRVGLPELF